MKKILMMIGVLALCGISINAVQDPPTDENAEKERMEGYNIYALPVPEDISFAGEEVPTEIPDVYERLDRELLVNTYWQSNMLLLLKRAEKYFPVIEPILKEHGVPEDFKYLAVAESSLTPAVSPAGARGIWQFMEGTAEDYGLEVNDNVDERYNLELATHAAADYLKESKEKFGSWTLAAAAYNAGRYGIQKQLERQKVDDYYDLLLGEETGRYVLRLIALKEIMSNPKKYGFNFREKDLYQPIPSKKVAVDTAVSDFPDFAEKFGINYKILKIHNPWLRETTLNNDSGKTYYIEIPEEEYYSRKN